VNKAVPPQQSSADARKDASIAAALEALRANRPLRAEELCRAWLLHSPGSVEHLRLLGHALIKQERHAEAEKALRLALSLQADFPHLHEDLGSVLALQQRFEEAVACFEQAIRIEPRLPLAHKKLGQALAALGRGTEADEAFEEYFDQAPDKARVALAMDHARAGRTSDAIETLRAFLRERPDDVDAMRFLAGIYLHANENLTDAEALLRRATSMAPGYTQAWISLGTLLHETNRYKEAIECFRQVIAQEPEQAAAWGGLANGQAHAGDMHGSAESYKRALTLNPRIAGHHMGYAHVLKTLGDQAAALRHYRAAIEQKPDFGEVYWSMANLKVFRFEDAEVAAMEKQLERSDLAESAEIHFRFALGKAYEDKGEYDKAWHHYETGNQHQRQKVFHDPVAMVVRHEGIIQVFNPEFLAKHAGGGFEDAAPIFIVGLPRSGSTLIEQILASHSQVEGTAELPNLNRLAESIGRYRTDRKEYPHSVADLRTRDFRAYGRQYIEETRASRSTSKPRFTDKLPNNFSHVGLAHLILPNARIINARRHPLDSCLGGYKQLFGKGQHFTYDAMDLATYYRQYHETMKHWHRVLPGKVLDVHYEETVADLETQVRRILEHCGLPFEEGCVRFHETQRAIKTASSEQVRRPIYTDAAGYWRRFERHLGTWREQLADIIAELPEKVRNAGL
jgi:tetratricopeptide (TPR) repeat protein